MIPEYPANSDRSKQNNPPKLQPVVTSKPEKYQKKENKYLKMIFAQDFRDVKDSLVTEYVQPKVKELVWSFFQAQLDFVTNALRMMVFKDFKPSAKPSTQAERYSYSTYYNQPNKPAPTMTTEVNYDELMYSTSGEAGAVLAGMRQRLEHYDRVTVADFYDLSDISTTNFALGNYGWKNLDFAEVKQVMTEDGVYKYIIALPKAKPLS